MSSHERRNIGGHNTARYQPIHSLTNESDRIALSWLNISHQKSDVPIFEEVFVVLHE